MILLITNKDDIHPNSVLKILNDKDVKIFRLNTECILDEYKISYVAHHNQVSIHFENVITGQYFYDYEITSVWYRRPEKPNKGILNDLDTEVEKYILREAGTFLDYLECFLLDKFSIGNSLYDRSASSKLLQLKTAKSLGMNIPSVIYSNDAIKCLEFAEENPFLALKPISDIAHIVGDYQYSFLTKKIKKEEVLEYPLKYLNMTYNHFESYVEKDFELRVTVICDDIFACKLDSQAQKEEEGKYDWRDGYEFGLKHEKFDLPIKIKVFCKEYLKKMKINFGCFDFIVTIQEEYIFLECNPNGQWLWIENETGLPISESIVKYLIKGSW